MPIPRHSTGLPSLAPLLRAALVVLILGSVQGCATNRQSQSAGATAQVSDDPACVALRAEIDREQKARRVAPSLSQSPLIADAAVAKADHRIDVARSHLEELDCDPAPTTP